jgi:hypothetical protein
VAQSKNSRRGRGKGVLKRMLDGQVVYPVKYIGWHTEYGTYMTGALGSTDGERVYDENGRPVPFRSIGKMELWNG